MKHHTGRLEVICGSMFSGKSEELIRRIRRAIIAKQEVQVFKPSLDYRYGLEEITSHNGQNIQALPVKRSDHMQNEIHDDSTVVAIDEVQFFDPGIVEVIKSLINDSVRVIVAGLDTDFRREPFGCMPQLLAIADDIQKLHAICVICGELACCTQRLVDGEPAYADDPLILIGAHESYEARCRNHHIIRHRHSQEKLF